MSWIFRKSFSLGKLFRVNLSRSGIGFSFGLPGFRIGVGADGKVRRTLSLPGTGLRHTEVIGKPSNPVAERPICPQCGRQVDTRDSFCRHCGGQL